MRSFAEYVVYRDLQEYEFFKSQVLAEVNQMYGGAFGLSDAQIDAGLDAIKLGLDVWGLEQFTGWIGDLISGGISGAQGLWKWYKGDNKAAAGHGVDAAVSLISAVPFGDIAKLIKLKYGYKYAKMFIQGARAAKNTAKAGKAVRRVARAGNVTGQFGRNVSDRAQQLGRQAGEYVSTGQPGAVAAMAKF